MKAGITFEVVWWDAHLVEYRFRCSNGYFSGQAQIYANHDDLSKLADALRGFPSHPSDSRDVELGTFIPEHADGGIRMHFYCKDSVGHAAVDVQLRGDACPALGEMQSVALRISVEAAAIDSFIGQIAKLKISEGGTVCLEMAGL